MGGAGQQHALVQLEQLRFKTFTATFPPLDELELALVIRGASTIPS